MAITLRLTDEQERALAALADAQGIGKREATVCVILEAADRHVRADDIAALSTRGRERYADLLDRLAE